MRPDGTPIYRYEQSPGVPPVSVIRFDTEAAQAGRPADHRHAHDFRVLVYVEKGTGPIAVDGGERRLRPGQVYAVPTEQVIGGKTRLGAGWPPSWIVVASGGTVDVNPCGIRRRL